MSVKPPKRYKLLYRTGSVVAAVVAVGMLVRIRWLENTGRVSLPTGGVLYACWAELAILMLW